MPLQNVHEDTLPEIILSTFILQAQSWPYPTRLKYFYFSFVHFASNSSRGTEQTWEIKLPAYKQDRSWLWHFYTKTEKQKHREKKDLLKGYMKNSPLRTCFYVFGV